MNWFLSLILCLVLQVDIKPENRVFNRSGSQCVWASLETCARHFGIQRLYDLTKRYKHATGPGEVNEVLASRNVRWFWTPMSPGDLQNLRNAIGWHWPVCVGLNGQHMVILIDVTNNAVKAIDNADPELKVQAWDLNSFVNMWDGWTVILDPRYEKKETKFLSSLDANRFGLLEYRRNNPFSEVFVR